MEASVNTSHVEANPTHKELYHSGGANEDFLGRGRTTVTEGLEMLTGVCSETTSDPC